MKLHSQEVATLTLWIFTHMKLWLPEHKCIHARGSHEWFISLDYTADTQTRKLTCTDHGKIAFANWLCIRQQLMTTFFGNTSLFELDVHYKVYPDNHHFARQVPHIIREWHMFECLCMCVYITYRMFCGQIKVLFHVTLLKANISGALWLK